MKKLIKNIIKCHCEHQRHSEQNEESQKSNVILNLFQDLNSNVILSETKDLVVRDASAMPHHDDLRHPEKTRHPEQCEGSQNRNASASPQHDVKAAFSLIEILQTVVLLGIIAGLAVSFFAKFNPDDKLFYATERMLADAVQEIVRQRCNDKKPACRLQVALPGEAAWQFWAAGNSTYYSCDTAYGAGVTYNNTTSYCEVVVAAGVNCPNGMSRSVDDNTKCIARPQCDPTRVYITGDNFARPYSFFICPNGIVDLRTNADVTVNGVVVQHSALCRGFQSLLNHKTQHTSAQDPNNIDQGRTCDPTPNVLLTNATTLANLPANPANNNYSMKLSNGALLYNLGSNFINTTPVLSNGNAGNYLKVFIKYDRLEDLNTLVADTTNYSAVGAVDAGDTSRARNIKNSNVWCIWIKDTGEVYRCDITE